jgi:hypothetical protein
MSFSLPGLFAGFAPLLMLCAAIVSIIAALAVLNDAKRILSVDASALKIMSPEVWALFCLFGNIPAFALYWVAHHSTLAK